MSDIELSYISQFQDSDGILISSGTGSIAAYRDKSGLITCVGGKGYLIGDEGSGYWIGAEGIRQSIRFFEENNHDEALGMALKQFYQIDSWREVVRIVYSASGRSKIASAAETVINAATDVSQIATEIVDRAVIDLARLYKIAKRASKSEEIRVIGGVLSNNSPLRSRLAQNLKVSLSNALIKPEEYAAIHGEIHVGKL
jgi:N-acetylglucosamine kinase-like BadF-type ATPase